MTVLVATSLGQALAALAADPASQVLAGGTDLMVEVNAGHRRAGSIVAVRAIDTQRGWARHGDTLHLGAGITFRELLEPELAALVPGLAQAARTVGSPQIRNAATIGGNLGTASPAGDSLPVLLALEGLVELSGPNGTRIMAIDRFLTGPKQTALEPGELITAVRVPVLRGGQEYLKVGVRNAMVIAIASLALVVDSEHRTVRVGLGSVGPTALRAPRAESFVAGQLDWDAPVPRLVAAGGADRFAELVAEAARPIDDHRATAAYRRHAIGVLARRALQRVVAH
jgi:CO/xanthine dehydrogenase FAD-binding subunit